MQDLLPNINIKVPENLYLKDPDSTSLGRRIVENAIEQIHMLGFEAFTFKKLGICIGSPESTVYRYFENKHKLLLYMVNWYWSWLEYRVLFATTNISEPKEKLIKAIQVVTETVTQDSDFSHINETLLHRIVICESTKAFLTKDIERENDQGCFSAYKRLVNHISANVLEINPDFSHPNTLVSTIIEGSHMQSYFSEHLPSITDCSENKGDVTRFFTQMAFALICK